MPENTSPEKTGPKNIIVLSDGTGNSSAKYNKTNVWRTYEALDLSDPEVQVAYYDDGIGTSAFKPLALVTGAVGFGLSRNVRQLYAYLCRNYKEGDRIYGFGFSRGSFTIRVLASFVAEYGLLNRNAFSGERDLWKKTTWLYRAYRKHHSGNGITPPLAWAVRGLRDLWPWQAMSAEDLNENFLHQNVEIEFLGLWDTVDAYGSPIDEMTKGWDNYVWPLSMRHHNLPEKVRRAVHSLSLDDERNSFHPLLWNEKNTGGNEDRDKYVWQDANAENIKDERLTQVWFAGMHANVGGGYSDDFLSYVPFNFILSQLGEEVVFNKVKRKEYTDAAREVGVMHDSRAGLQSYYRLLPRKLDKLLDTRRKRFMRSGRIGLKFFDGNVVKIARPKIHHSVFDRIKDRGTGYSPIVLPEYYAEVAADGAIKNLGMTTHESAATAKVRAMAQERVWDLVWCRRVTYFTTLFFTFILALLPWIKSVPTLAIPGSPLVELDAGKCIGSMFCFLAGIPKLLGAFLPAFANLWIEVFSANPGIFGVLAGIILALMYAGKRLDDKIHDRMTAIWHSVAALKTTYSRLHNFRESKAYQWTLRRLKKDLLPLFFGIVSLASIILVSISGVSRIFFSLADSTGDFCTPEAKVQPVAITAHYSPRLEFKPSEDCWPTGLAAEKGATYRVVLNISGTMGSWKDDMLEADLLGNMEDHKPWIAIPAWPSKRYVWENYYKPVARIRTHAPRQPGQDEYILNPTFGSSKKRYDCLVSDFTAQSTGELFLFVNDAIIYAQPDAIKGTYKNNSGTAEVYVKRVAIAGEPFALPPEMTYTSACNEFVFTPP